MIIKRRCDKPMARKKGLLPCKHRCKTCNACIQMDDSGRESHVSTLHGGDPALQARNLAIRGMYGGFDD